MKRALLSLATLIGGAAVGGASAFAVGMFLPNEPEAAGKVSTDSEEFAFVPTGAVLAPLVTGDGELAGYANFELQLQVAAERQEEIAAKIPLLLHAINLRTYRVPLAAGPGGQIPNLEKFRRLTREAADQALGAGSVRRIAITQARPE